MRSLRLGTLRLSSAVLAIGTVIGCGGTPVAPRQAGEDRPIAQADPEPIEAVEEAAEQHRRSQSASNLERIGRALHEYHQAHGRLPAYIRSADGTPLLSWRVALLPHLGERALYDEFHLDEPWDGPRNVALLGRMPAVFALPGAPPDPGMTYYRSFSGPGTLFDPADKVAPNFASITDGLSRTLAVVEAREAVPWTRPGAEIPIDGEGLRASDAFRRRIGGHFTKGANALFLDGSVKLLTESLSALTLKSITTGDAADVVAGTDTSGGTRAETDFEVNKSLFAAIKTADRLLLYEGLPHQGYEGDLLEEEKRTKETVTLRGFPFYRTPLAVTPADRQSLKSLLEDERSFRQWGGEKLCDGFHPDYLVECRVGGAPYQFLICLGCDEVKAFGGAHSLRADIERGTNGRISDVLSKYRKNRPVRRRG